MTLEPRHVTWEKRVLKAVSSRGWGMTMVDAVLVLWILVLMFLYA